MKRTRGIEEASLVAACFSILGGPHFYDLQEVENLGVADVASCEITRLASIIAASGSALEDLFEQYLLDLRPKDKRHASGMVFTPEALVRDMVMLAGGQKPDRVVDCGCGAGRFAARAAEMLHGPDSCASVMAFDIDPLACLLTKTIAAIRGLEIEVVREDFLHASIPPIDGVTVFIGNPPYIRHHDLSPEQKETGACLAREASLKGWSKLAGMHVLFIAKCLANSCKGDAICFLTGSEWLDVNYGKPIRNAFASQVGGGSYLRIYAPEAEVFDGVMSTALVSLWRPLDDANESVLVERVDSHGIEHVYKRSHACLRALEKWSSVNQVPQVKRDGRLIELGALFRVSRGVVTGNNKYFVMKGKDAESSGLAQYTVPVIASASDIPVGREEINQRLLDNRLLVLNDDANVEKDENLKTYLEFGEALGIDDGYVASHRSKWYQIAYNPAPVVATYMSRGRPRFAMNIEKLPSLNTVHGLYPRVDMTAEELRACVDYLNNGPLYGDSGRVYQGGLRKFEPREMEKMQVPPLDQIVEWSFHHAKKPAFAAEME